ncbi:MAG: hypothetical protein JWP35_1962 [Caulobacter sp.]|nr:hypothetical protein [Caulobacter sp.]
MTASGPADQAADDVCALPLVRRVGALLDMDMGLIRTGQALPRGWHFILFGPLDRQGELSPDGFPAIREAFTAQGAWKVMLGGRRMTFDGDIPIGAPVRRERTIVSTTPKEGRSGRLVVVRRRHEIFAADASAPAVTEIEDMIYREVVEDAGAKPAAPVAGPPEARAADATAGFTPTEVMLFRYSAVTFNAHRIHYDLAYARDVEGYPGLVVNGGLTSLMLLELFRRESGREANEIAARNVRPLFVGDTATLNLKRNDDGWSAWAADGTGHTVAELEIR